MSAAQQPSRPERIIVRGVNWLGDAVMSTPALQRLREARPGAHITLLTHAKLKDLWPGHAAVDAVETFAADESVWSIGRRLKSQSFDVGLILPNSPRSALEFWLGGVRERVGYARPWRNWFLTRAVPVRPGAIEMHKRTPAEVNALINTDAAPSKPIPPQAHHIHQYLHLVAALGGNPQPVAPQVFVTSEEVEAVKKKFGLHEIRAPIFGINPGAEYGPAKRWPAESFIRAANEIHQRTNCVWLIFGGPNDAQTASAIEDGISAIKGNRSTTMNLAGKTTLRELMALLKACRVLLANDSGPMHIAAALGTSVVVPFGSTSPELTGPGLPGDPRHHLLRANAPCSPCFLRQCPIDFRCMTGITVEQVVQAVLQAAG